MRRWCTGGGRTAGAKTRSTRTSSGETRSGTLLFFIGKVQLTQSCLEYSWKGERVQPYGQEGALTAFADARNLQQYTDPFKNTHFLNNSSAIFLYIQFTIFALQETSGCISCRSWPRPSCCTAHNGRVSPCCYALSPSGSPSRDAFCLFGSLLGPFAHLGLYFKTKIIKEARHLRLGSYAPRQANLSPSLMTPPSCRQPL